MCLYVTSVKLSGSRAKVNSPALGSGVMGAEMFFLRNPGTPVGFWLGPGRGQGERQSPQLPPTRTHTSRTLFMIIIIIIILYLNHLLLFGSFLNACTKRFFIISLTFYQLAKLSYTPAPTISFIIELSAQKICPSMCT